MAIMRRLRSVSVLAVADERWNFLRANLYGCASWKQHLVILGDNLTIGLAMRPTSRWCALIFDYRHWLGGGNLASIPAPTPVYG